jgi:HK97 family phage portal protein
MERFMSLWYAEGGTPSSVLETDSQFTEEQARVLQATWDESHRQRRRPAVLSGGLKWKPITVSAADMGLLESREHQVRSIARVFRIPAHMILAQGDSQTYQNIESAGIAFVRHTLMPWIGRIESVLSQTVGGDIYVRLQTEEFMRADLLNRVRAQQIQIMNGTLTPNEARYQLGLEPYTGGDEFVMVLPGAPLAGPGIEPAPVGEDELPPQ